ncbi:lytic transglycosylase [Comamonas phosphati]|nr:lytic transglycosylase [Comamonas phosphati]
MPWKSISKRLASLVLAGGAALAGYVPAAHADLWAYVDELGVTHFAAEALDERYKLYFKGNVYDSTLRGRQGLHMPRGAASQARSSGFFEVSPGFKSVSGHVRKAADTTGVDFDLLKAVIAVESGFDAGAVSPKGAVGLMQLMPATAQRFGVAASKQRSIQQQLADPAVNVPAGARYLNYLMGLFPGRLDLVLAAYNAGEGAVQRAGQAIPPFKETRNYVKAVMGIYEQLQAARPLAPGTRVASASGAAAASGRSAPRIRMTLPAPTVSDAPLP